MSQTLTALDLNRVLQIFASYNPLKVLIPLASLRH